MELTNIQNELSKIKKGTFVNMSWGKQLKTRKGIEDIITKESSGNVRLGINYDNMYTVKDKREIGELPESNQGLKGMQWIQFPYLLQGKNSVHLRVYPTNNNPINAKYYKNGIEITRDEAKEYCLKSEFPNSIGGMPDCLNIKIENIKTIKGNEVQHG